LLHEVSASEHQQGEALITRVGGTKLLPNSDSCVVLRTALLWSNSSGSHYYMHTHVPDLVCTPGTPQKAGTFWGIEK
jgi:hypothetical protein